MIKESVIIKNIDDYTHDASPSWNGYNHQGKVAVYIALKWMEELSEEDIDKYELELEYLEDFSIKKEGEYISIHQVKTLLDTGLSKYKEATWLLLSKLLDIPKVKNAYLHVTQKLTNVEKFKEKLPTYTMSEDCTGQRTSNRKKNMSPKECYDNVMVSGKYDEIVEKFNFYEYETKNLYCSFEEIEEFIKIRLKNIIGDGSTKTRIDRAYHYLLGLIDRNIRERHSNIQSEDDTPKVTIKFSDIKKIVRNNFDSVSKEYAAYYLKNEFNRISQSYLDDLNEEYRMNIISEDGICIVNKLIKQIYELDEEMFIEFCLKITPNNTVNKEHPDHIINMIRISLEAKGLNECFFETVKEIKKELEEVKWVYNQKNKEGENITYLPSTINDQKHPSRDKKLAIAIFNNGLEHPELLSEVDKIITSNINMDAIENSKINEGIPEHEESYEERSEDYHNRIANIKKISLIDLYNAKGEIKIE